MNIRKMPTIPTLPKKKQVAAYARVSSGKDAMLHSLSAQISYYSEYIQKQPEWLYRGVYVDEAITGTKAERPEFQRLLSDCRAGKIDMIVTKSISRFARNTVTLLATVRELKAIGVDVFFEEPNIHTMSAAGEMMLTLLASVAQEESRLTSERMKWRVRKNFEEGVPWNSKLLGYRLVEDRYVIVPDEADTVRRIYSLFLSGMGPLKIAKILNDEGRRTSEGYPWQPNGVSAILRNDAYTGNLTLQKTFRIDHICKTPRKNDGECAVYKVGESHDAIISQATFDAVQAGIARRADEWKHAAPKTGVFTGKLLCENCGKHYRRRTVRRGHVWQCATYALKGKSACASKQVPEDTLMQSAAIALDLPVFDAEVFDAEIIDVRVCGGNKLTFRFHNGSEKEVVWRDRSRSESWTDEMKQKAREKTYGRCHQNTGDEEQIHVGADVANA
ncbi:MAG: recombinase family protein [Clostridia bacterium]|nr:recombinase family protein [Clostridia bacterium]